MNKKNIFNNYLTDHYSNVEKTDFNNSNSIITLLKKNQIDLNNNLLSFFNSKINKNSKILDLGCGYGSFIYFLQSHKYKYVTGVDMSEEEIKLCKKLFKTYNFIQTDFSDLFKNSKQRYDVIYLSHVLEHINKEELIDFVKKIKDMLTDNGYIIIVVPNSAAYFNSAANRYGDLTHEIGFTKNSINQLMGQIKFKQYEIKNYYGAGNWWIKLLRKFSIYLFEKIIQILGFEVQAIYTPSLIAIIKNN